MSPVSRRTLLAGGAATAASVLAGVGFVETASAGGGGHKPGHPSPSTYRLTVMGTTDLHGNVFNWDYFKNAEYDDAAHNDIGLAKVSTLVNAVRAERGRAQHAAARRRRHHPGHPAGVLLRQDRADPARVDPPDGRRDEPMGYDAAALGNHEFNYGIDDPAHLPEPAGLPAARRERGGREDRRAGVPAVRRSSGHGRGAASRSRSASWA